MFESIFQKIKDCIQLTKVLQVKYKVVYVQRNIKNKVVMVTGAGGTIGSQLCREILVLKPNKLLLLDSNEYSLYKN